MVVWDFMLFERIVGHVFDGEQSPQVRTSSLGRYGNSRDFLEEVIALYRWI